MDVAAQAARVILMRSDPSDIARAMRLSKATVRTMKQNLASALLMSMSSIVVAVNAVSSRRARI